MKLILHTLLLLVSDPVSVLFIVLAVILIVVITHLYWVIKINRIDLKKQLENHCKNCPLNRRRKNYV